MTRSEDGNHAGGMGLNELDAAALDALLNAGGDPAGVEPHMRARAEVISRLLGLLDSPASGMSEPGTLADVTMARIARAGSRSNAADAEATLSPEDHLAVEALLAGGYRVDRVPGALRARADRAATLLALIDSTPGPAWDAARGASLTERTMAAVPIRVRRASERSWRATVGSFRLTDLVSIAAMLLIAGSVAWPVMSAARAHSSKTQCGANMSAVAAAMGLYGGDYKGALPAASAGLAGASWWDVGAGPGHSNSANLFTLAKHSYASLRDLACPGNAQAERGGCDQARSDWSSLDQVSYSYQILFGEHRPAWERGPGLAVLADASPVIRRQRMGLTSHPFQNSANHGGTGQWILRNDGSGGWTGSPVQGQDNIWLPGIIEVALRKVQERAAHGESSGEFQIRGDELPNSDSDSFLGP